MSKRIVKYNPAFLSQDELVKSFVVRHAELGLIVQVLRENVTQSNQHVLVIGPRGIGKTMLVLRAVEEVRKEKDLNEHWYPLVFSEESYRVTTPGEFWLEALFHLGQQTGDSRWKQTYRELGAEQDEGRLRERALAQLMDFADSQGKRIVLVVENFNMLLGEQIDDNDGWALRHTLLNEPRVMLLATATSRFEGIDNADKPMFELLRTLELKPLEEGECRTLWTAITGKEPTEERVRPIQILTGGNPRLLSIISSFASRLSLKKLMADLMQLVDEHTEYFKSHLDGLPSIERKVYLGLAELWDPATARQVADATRLDVNKTSSLLRRLMERGAVVLADGRKRTKLYQLAERMYNIYYLMRRRGAPSRRVRALVNFLVGFYGQEELVKLTQRIAEEACVLEPALRQDHYYAFEGIMQRACSGELCGVIIKSAPANFLDMPDIPASIRTVAELEETKEELVLLKKVKDLLTKENEPEKAEKLCRAAVEAAPGKQSRWLAFGMLLEKLERYDEAEEAYRKAIEVGGKSARVWTNLGRLLHQKLERYDEAEKAYRSAIEIDEKSAWTWAYLAQLLLEKLTRYDEAEKALRKAIEFKPDEHWFWEMLGWLLHKRLGRYEEAEGAYQKALKLGAGCFTAWEYFAELLHGQLARYAEAEEAYRKAISLKPDFARAWAKLAQLLHEKLDQYEEAEKAYSRAIELKPDDAWSWTHLGILLQTDLGRPEEAEKAYRKSIEIDAKYPCSWVYLGGLLQERKRFEEADRVYKKAIEKGVSCAYAWEAYGRLLHKQLGRYEEAELAYRKAIEHDPTYGPTWHGLAVLLVEKLNRPKDLLQLAEKYIAEHPGEARLRNSLAWAVYKNASPDLLMRAKVWAEEALAMEPEDTQYQHTLASILCVLGEGYEALKYARKYLEDMAFVETAVDDATDLFIGLAAAGYGQGVLEIVRESPSAQILEPLVVGLQLYLGEDVKVAPEIMEVGKDVVKRIEQRRDKMQSEKAAKGKADK